MLAELPGAGVIVAFATQHQLAGRVWHPTIQGFLLKVLATPRPANHAAQGYIDFTTGNQYIK
jgi:hypothetical protein